MQLGITFKDEDEVAGLPVGPVMVWDFDDESGEWIDTPIGKAQVVGVPFGQDPPGLIASLGWMYKVQALALAEQMGLELEDS